MIPLLLRIAIVLLGSWVIGHSLDRWLQRPDINPTLVKRAGIASILLVLTATFIPTQIKASESPILLNYGWWVNLAISRVLIGILVFIALVGVMRIGKYFSNIHEIPSKLITPGVLFLLTKGKIIGDETKETLVLSRDQLETELRELSGVPGLAFRWVEGCQLPFTVGFFRPMICCPLWISQVEEGGYLQVLLHHEAEHVSLGHHRITFLVGVLQAAMPWLRGISDATLRAMELEVDVKIVRDSDDLGQQYKNALHTVVQQARGTVLAGIGHDPRHIETRVQQMGHTGTTGRWSLVGVVSLGMVMVGCSVGVGRPALGDLLRISLRQQGRDIRIITGDPKALVIAIPHAGGRLTSGIGIDARTIHGSQVTVESFPREPISFAGEAEILMSYRVKGSGTVRPMVTASISQEPQQERIAGTGVWMQTDQYDDSDLVDLIEGHGEIVLKIQGTMGSPYELSGPRIRVPKGWMVEVTNIRVRPMSRRDSAHQRDHTEGVQRHSKIWQGFGGAEGPQTPNLSWSPDRGLVGF